ncbi:ribonuclease HI family protein [Patescibacteria group bacterium]
MKLKSYSDGGSRNNPGPAGIGGVLLGEDDEIIESLSEYIGTATNNEAEYQALIHMLELAIEQNTDQLDCFLDSELVVRQAKGEYRVKDAKLKPLFVKLKQLEAVLPVVTYNHVPREENEEADKRVNQALDEAGY